MKRLLNSSLVATVVVFLLVGCGHEPVAVGGGGTDWEARVSGTALYSDLTPARGAIVICLPDSFRAAPPNSREKLLNATPVAVVDENGRFQIDSLAPGSYSIEILDLRTGEPSQASHLTVSIPDYDSMYQIDTAVLAATGAVSGTIDRSSVGTFTPLFVRIVGLNRVVTADTSGRFVVKNLAPSTYSLEVGSSDNAVLPRKVPVTIVSDSTHTLPTIVPYIDHVSDAIVVRSILDTIGLTSVPVEAVSSSLGGRIVDLNFTYYHVKRLPESIGNLALLKNLWITGDSITSLPTAIGRLAELTYLNLSHSGITALPPEIGRCTKLRQIEANSARLATLPPEIGSCISLDTLELNNNGMTSLPESIMRLPNLSGLNISNNRICTASDSLKAWLTSKMPGWSFSQDCK